MSKLVLDQVFKRFDSTEIIHGVSLDISAGEFVVFVGPSGCGKSTLLRMIAGLETVTAGSILIDGERINNVPPARRGIAMVFQSYALYPHMSVYQNLAFGLQTLGAAKVDIETKVAKAAKVLQIEPLLQRKPKQLSGGQRQRVAIGRAIVRDPRIFLFDEPLSNLDAELRVQMRVEIAALHEQLRTTMIYVTHDQVEAMTLADRIVVLRLGAVEQIGTPLELYNKPVNKFVAGFLGSPKMNFLSVNVTGRSDGVTIFDLAGVRISLPVTIAQGSPGITLGVRPEHVVAANKGGLSLGSMKVTHVEQLGGNAFVYGRLADGQSMTLSLDGQQNINAGQDIPISVDPALCHAFDGEGSTVNRQEIQPRALSR
ncbi:MAG TPA: sn-glycerol-3-phosphate ABC transporter ATP-binding protein UgpC [Casimicrobiaceae bacterium]|jgi:multiple sugar transport system ATP-binding protein|nr:sn-glycerol-3-phosphate ABC transporter ATP-binding protein UgpC [Casimicrobiaceae bacterium]